MLSPTLRARESKGGIWRNRPLAVDGVVLSPTLSCELSCAITHRRFVLSPTRTPSNARNHAGFVNRNARARFLTFKIFNALGARGTPSGFPRQSRPPLPPIYRGPSGEEGNTVPAQPQLCLSNALQARKTRRNGQGSSDEQKSRARPPTRCARRAPALLDHRPDLSPHAG